MLTLREYQQTLANGWVTIGDISPASFDRRVAQYESALQKLETKWSCQGRQLQKFFRETPEFQIEDPSEANSFQPLCKKFEWIKNIIANKLQEFSDNVNTQLMDPIVNKVRMIKLISTI